MTNARLLALLLLSAACGREEISVRREAKDAPHRHEMSAASPAAPSAAAPGGVRWTVPKGWTEQAGGNMRVASFKLPAPSEKAEVTVATFPGDVGGELANVNRWRGQIALPPVDEAALSDLRQRVASRAGEALVYDFTSTGEPRTRLVATSLKVDDATWFFKLVGPEPAVAAARPAFLDMIKELRRDSL